MPGGLVEIGDVVYDKNESFKTGTLRIKGASTIRVKNGAVVAFECETLIIDGKVYVDTHGDDGNDGVPGASSGLATWVSGMHHDDHQRRHWEWKAATETPVAEENGKNAIPGTDGTDAGHLLIRYRKLGEGSNLGSVSSNIDGGKAGKSAAGGAGRTLICGAPDHSGREQYHRPSGASWEGRSGKTGSVRLERF